MLLIRDLGSEASLPSQLVSGAVWHDCGARSGKIDCEVFWLSPRVAHTAALTALAPLTVASILHEGDDSKILATYEAAYRWIRDNRYRIFGPNRARGPEL